MQNTRILIFRLWKVLSRKRQNQLIILVIFMAITSISELLTIGSLIPFLTVLSNTEKIPKNGFFNFLLNIYGTSDFKDLLLPLALIFAIFAIISSSLRILEFHPVQTSLHQVPCKSSQ